MEQASIVSSKKLVNEEAKILRECRGRRLAISRRVYRIKDTRSNNSYYVKSESKDIFYYIEYKNTYCTCWDFYYNRSEKCKHIYAVEYAIHLGLVQTVDHKLPISQKPVTTIPDHYRNLSIATLNELEKAEIEAEAYRTKPQQSWTEDEYSF